MIKRASLVVLLGVLSSTSAQAHMQQGYANGQPDVKIDRSVLQDLKGYQPPPMFGGDLMPPTTNRVDVNRQIVEEPKKSIEVTSPKQPAQAPAPVIAPPTTPMTAPNAEALLNHPTQNFHVLTERNASVTATPELTDNGDGPLLPLPDEDIDPAAQHAKAMKTKAEKQKAEEKSTSKKEPKKADNKKDDKKKETAKKTESKAEAKKEKSKPIVEVKELKTVKKPDLVKVEPIKSIPPNPNAYRPKAPQSMPAVPPIQVEKNILPPLSGSPLPSLPPTTDTTEAITKPSPGLRMMDAALERQMESDQNKIKEQLAETNVKTVKPGTETVKPKADEKPAPKSASAKTLVFAEGDTNVSDKIKKQIKSQILPELEKDTTSRIQIISFATSPDKDESSARRISLSRSLAVRDYLKSLKIDTARIDVRALASDGNSVPPNKVDIVLLK